MANVLVPASADGKYASCIYTQLPLMPEAWKSKKVPVETLIQMSQRENFLRVEDEFYRELFFLVHRDAPGDGTMFNSKFVPRFKAIVQIDPQDDEALQEEPLMSSASVIIMLQYQVLHEFGYDPINDAGTLYELRTAAMMHPDIAELQDSVQFRFNRQGNPHAVVEGQVGPDCELFDPVSLNARSFHLLLKDLTDRERLVNGVFAFAHYPTVVLTGSYT
jgi:hypothetical protein